MSDVRARPKRYTYRTSLQWDGAGCGTQRSEQRPPLRVAPPPEFKGPEGVWSPEHLLVASLESCVLLTFLYLARRQGVELVGYESETEGVLELSGEGMAFTEFILRPRVIITPGGDVGAAEEALRRAADSCLVHRSLKCQVRLEAQVTEAPA